MEMASRGEIMNRAPIELQDIGLTLPSEAGDVEIRCAGRAIRKCRASPAAKAAARGREPADRAIGRIALKTGPVSPIFPTERTPFRRLRAIATVKS
ncbi:MAG: hypothetical protein ACE5EU_10530 [Paracoccaceae bacterium]